MRIQKSIRNLRGFTLLELVVVIALLGILVLIALPKFESALNKQKLQSAADQIETNLKYSQGMAIYTGYETKVVIESSNSELKCYVKRKIGSNTYTIEKEIDLDSLIHSYGGFRTGTDQFVRLTNRKTVTYTASGSPGGDLTKSEETRTIGLLGKSGDVIKITILPSTGRVRQYEIK